MVKKSLILLLFLLTPFLGYCASGDLILRAAITPGLPEFPNTTLSGTPKAFIVKDDANVSYYFKGYPSLGGGAEGGDSNVTLSGTPKVFAIKDSSGAAVYFKAYPTITGGTGEGNLDLPEFSSSTLSGAPKVFEVEDSLSVPYYFKTYPNNQGAVLYDYARFTGSGFLEGRSHAEVRADLNVEYGADVTGDHAPKAHVSSHESGGSDVLAFDSLADGTTYKKFLATERTKLSGIESGATADQTGAEIKIAYEAEADTNAYTDAEKSKLSGIESSAEVNVQSDWNAASGDAFILNKPSDVTDLSGHAVTELSDVTGAGSGIIISDTERTKLSGIESGAEVNVYPGAGIALSTGSAWGTSVEDNSTNWNTAYGWGDHSLAGYLTTLTGHNVIELDDVSGAGSGSIISSAERTKLSGIEDNAVALPVVDTTSVVKGSVDGTKLIRFEVDGLTTATARVLTVQDKDITIADNSDIPASTTDLPEGTNLYYTEARVSANSDVAANIAKVTESTTVSAPLALDGYDISIPVATSAANGYLTSADWTTFNNKQSALPVADTQTVVKGSVDGTKLLRFEADGLTTATTRVLTVPDKDFTLAGTDDLHDAVTIGTANGLSLATQALSLAAASSTVTGALTSTDWGIFNGKEPGLGNPSVDGYVLSSTIAGVRSWVEQTSGGDVSGPASAVSDHVVFFDGTTGKLIKDSGLTLSGGNTGDQDLSGLALKTTTISTTSPLAGGGDLSADRTFSIGDLPVSHLNSGTGASATTFWRGDGTWATPSGGMVYPGAGIALSTGSAWGTSITNNSANWNTAYNERRQWDGGNTNLNAATGRSSLNVENGATADQTGSEIVSLINAGADLIDDNNIASSIARDSEVNAKVSDAAYDSGWNGVTTIAPSKNAIYDKIESIGGGSLWTDESASAYYRPNNVVNSGNTGFRIYDAGYSQLGQVSPTTGNNFGGGSTDGTVLKINHGNSGGSTNSANPPLWVKRHYNYSGSAWNAGAAYFGCKKTANEASLHTVQIDTYCSGGTVPVAGGVLGGLLSYLKNDSVTGSGQDIHNIQAITYTPSVNYSSVHAAVMVDLNNRYGSKNWIDDYGAGWTGGVRVANESSGAYDNSCAYSIGTGGGGGKWYIGYEVNQIAYDSGSNKGEGIYFKTGSFDSHAICMRAEGILDARAGTDINLYYGSSNWINFRTGSPVSYTDRMHLDNNGNLVVSGSLSANSLGDNLSLGGHQINGTGTIELVGAKIKSDALLLNARSGTPSATWTNGLMYYDTSSNQLRVYKSGAWHDVTTN